MSEDAIIGLHHRSEYSFWIVVRDLFHGPDDSEATDPQTYRRPTTPRGFSIRITFETPSPSIPGIGQPTCSSQKASSLKVSTTSGRWPSWETRHPPGTSSGYKYFMHVRVDKAKSTSI